MITTKPICRTGACSIPTARSPPTAIPRMATIMGMTMIATTTRSTVMRDDFFTRALVAGIGLALTTGPLGCLIVWRRMAYFGDTMAHSALLGVALGFLFEINLTVGVFIVAVLASLALLA